MKKTATAWVPATVRTRAQALTEVTVKLFPGLVTLPASTWTHTVTAASVSLETLLKSFRSLGVKMREEKFTKKEQ
jgi:hypothetical protein